MTKSTITREQAEETIEGLEGLISRGVQSVYLDMALAGMRQLLDAMDSEPVAEVYQAPNVGICAALGPSIRMLCPLEPGTKLYRHAQPAPVVPEGYVMVPKVATEKMLIAGLEEADPLGSLIDWDASRGDCNTREQVQEMFEAMLAAAPQSPGSEPATVPGKWIPASERMPESNGVYFGWDGKRVLEVYCFFGGFSANQFIHGEITHWMPLPAGPKEVKGE